jgi:hypothetical protein
MGLTKSELSAKFNEAFESIYGEWKKCVVIDLTKYKITREIVDEVCKYKNEWCDMVNRHNQYYECRINSISRSNGDDTTNYFHLTCRWTEIDRFYVEYTYEDDSESVLAEDK